MSTLTIKDFYLLNTWKEDKEGMKWPESNIPKYLIDLSTNKRYLNEQKSTVRIKCCLLAGGSVFIHPLQVLKNVAPRVNQIVKLSLFFLLVAYIKLRAYQKKGDLPSSMKNMMKPAFYLVLGKDLFLYFCCSLP